MLAELRIENLAVIDSVELSLHAGLNVLTGETGAGKSIIVTATDLLRGARGSSALVRKGADQAVVEALFDLRRRPSCRRAIDEHGLPLDGDELLVRRVLSRSGRGRIYVNGSLCTAAVLSRLMRGLLDISGQHESLSLGDRAAQRQLLDATGPKPALLDELAAAHAEVIAAAEALQRTQLDDRQRAERAEFLRYQLREIEAAELVAGEDEQLEARCRKLRKAADLRKAAAEAEALLYARDGAITEQVSAVQRQLDELSRVDAQLSAWASQLEEARLVLEDAAVGLGGYAREIDLDPEQLQQAEDRLALVRQLQRKHGGPVREILERAEQMRSELVELDSLDQRREACARRLAQARGVLADRAERVSRDRARAARKLSRQVTGQLSALGMKGARLDVRVEPLAAREGDERALVFDGRRAAAHGWDQVNFAVATNPGEDPQPVGRIASGGELSRLMLALRQALGRHDGVATAVFDEVDAGIGGAVADVVGRALADVARHRQVLLVTHLPQVAAYADAHFLVGKATGRGKRARAHTTVIELRGDERVEGLARMLAASDITDEARANARQLIAAAAG